MILIYFLKALLITEIVEIVVAYLMGYRGKYFFTILVLTNMLTNPVLNYTLTVLIYLDILNFHSFVIIIFEIIVVWVEFRIFIYTIQRDKKDLFLLSLAINSASYLVGLLFFT